ncbi:type I polyketide synthase [Gloeocapsa sp. PCC 73106]|uniref:type I polyketide synthase n=1 Tax=Gloeocapsa sp. PCC 73106 TaxID=102232 RepID=UPI0002ABF791|nr:type I polyketide synthase [Gloeocapsa sp. PCC 73106]ELR97465.1 beta-ketoacyl synthase/acyltransferase [Gloeocapsa sp. PCC 73106]
MTTSIKQALITIKQLQKQIKELQNLQNEPIAIISMACRFPGGINNPDDFWQLLLQGRDGITDIPAEHWDADIYYDQHPDSPGKMYTKRGGFIPDLKSFDAQFFNISPREATSLDPQQRILLEVTWEALENAGITIKQLSGHQTGVFIGICGNDYGNKLLHRDPEQIDAYLTTGNDHSLASGRLSYFLDLTGPSLSINTACSSSLVALHLAIKSLRNQECDLAIVGGVNRIINPKITINFCQARMLSPEGLCQTFDASANGFVRSEGCGVVILKRLTEAIASGDHILAVIYGSAVNQDGRTSGLTAPNGRAQEAVIKQALKNSRKQVQEISYIEAHGTGTWLGDPIEVKALSRVLNGDRSVYLGSVKANLGHLEAAAGIASLIKVVLCLKHKAIPPQIHFHNPNPQINWSEIPVIVPQQLTPWVGDFTERVAGVSSFGFSGTNAHAIVGESQSPTTTNPKPTPETSYLFTLSAKSEPARKDLISRYCDFLTDQPELDLADLCYSATVGRSHFNYRLAVVTSSVGQLQQQLTSLLTQHSVTDVFLGKLKSNRSPEIAFLLPQEAVNPSAITKILSLNYPVFGEAIAECDRLVSSYSHSDIPESLALFTLEYGLVKLWQTWGIFPKMIIAHGVGEWVAATIAGRYTLAESLRSLIDCNLPQNSNNTADSLQSEQDYDYVISMALNSQNVRRSLLTNLAQLYLLGAPLDWLACEAYRIRPKIVLPNYPFQRTRYWVD